MVLQVVTEINRELIIKVLSGIKLPEGQESVSDFVSQVIIKDGKLVFAIKVDEKHIESYQRYKQQVQEALLQLDGVDEVVISLTSHISPEKKIKNGAEEKYELKGVKKIIMVASGKGGVGKSTVAFNLAAELANEGKKVGLVDLDIYGPSLGVLSGIKQKPVMSEGKVVPHKKFGIKMMSVSYLLDRTDEALAWRGPMISKMLYQLLNLTDWSHDGEEVEVLIIDTPPGTGDVHISLCSKYQIDSAVVVTTPSVLATADVKKSLNLLDKFAIKVDCIINNMAFLEQNGKRNYIFGEGGAKIFAGYKVIDIPIHSDIAKAAEFSLPFCEFNQGKAFFTGIIT